MSRRRPHRPPNTGKPLDEIQPRKKRVHRKPIRCESDPPCGCADCSVCTEAFVDLLYPQIETQLLAGTEWLPFSLVWSSQTFSDWGLGAATFNTCARALRDKFRSHSLSGIPFIGALDINREDYLSPEGFVTGYLWSIHVHGFMRVDDRKAEIEALFKAAFSRSAVVPMPFLLHESGLKRGWTEYLLKDPSRIGKRIHDPRVRWPYKRQLTNREGMPVMDFLAKQRVRDRLLLQGYQWQGRRLVPINDFGRWRDASTKGGDAHPPQALTRVRTRNR